MQWNYSVRQWKFLTTGEGRKDVQHIGGFKDAGPVPERQLIQEEAAAGEDLTHCGRRGTVLVFECNHNVVKGGPIKVEVFLRSAGGRLGGAEIPDKHSAADRAHGAVGLDKVLSTQTGVVHSVGLGLGPHGLLPAAHHSGVVGVCTKQVPEVGFLA